MIKTLNINLDVVNKNELLFKYVYDNGEFQHKLIVPNKLILDNFFNSAARLAIFSRPVNAQKITLAKNLVLDEKSKSALEKTLQTKIETTIKNYKEFYDYKRIPENFLIAFSGGFDSISALALLGENVTLFSVDYLGWFKRERQFFEKFNTDIFEWDIRQRLDNRINFDENLDYRFLISPCTFYVNQNLQGLITGTVLEASEYQYNPKLRQNFLKYSNEVFGDGISSIPLISSLSEFCTAKIANLYLGSDRIAESLQSLAAENSFKTYRKKCLLAAVSNAKFPEKPDFINKHIFGRYFTDDIVTLYFIWKFGYEVVRNNYCEDIDYKIISDIDMSFFERVNTNNLMVIDPVLKCNFLKKLNSFDVEPYKDNDLNLLANSIYIRNKIIENKIV